MKPQIFPFLLLMVTLGLGCSKPNSDVLHTLRALQPDGVKATPALNSPALEVMPIRLPEVLRRPQLVVEFAPGSHRLLETHRWGNGLELDFQRVLIENLTRLLGSEAIVAFPHGQRVKATYRLEVEVHHLVGKPGGNLSLQATWMLCPGQAGPALLLKKISLEKPVQGLDAEALVAAHSQIIGDLSREVALELGTFLGRSK